MKSGQQQSTPEQRSGNLLLLLLSLLFALLVAPVMEQVFDSRVVIYAGGTVVLVFGVFVNRRRNRLFLPCLAVAILAVSTLWSTLVVDYPLLFVTSKTLAAAFYATIACILTIRILKKHLATMQSVFGAVCVYLLLGLSWAQLYWATERMDGRSLSSTQREAEEGAGDDRAIAPYSRVVYFSFVTMSTLGYGDIVPETPLARTLTWMQSVMGQFYLAVLVAWIVSAVPRRGPPVDGSHTEQDKENDQ